MIQNKEPNMENFPHKESIRKQWREPGHYPKENRNCPVFDSVKKLIKGSTGQLWDDIYSAICAKFPKPYNRSEADRCIDCLVEFDCVISDGEILDAKGEKLFTWRTDQFYVLDGILHKHKHKPWPKRERPQGIVYMEDQAYYQHDGIWYRVVITPMETVVRSHDRFGYVFAHSVLVPSLADVFFPGENEIFYYCKYGVSVTCSEKQQANSKEIRRILNQLEKT